MSLDTPLTVAKDWTDERPCVLYRFYDADERLLYVGISVNGPARWADHTRTPWWTDARRVAMEPHPTRAEAGKAEATAIRTERPIHNIHHNDLALRNQIAKMTTREAHEAVLAARAKLDRAQAAFDAYSVVVRFVRAHAHARRATVLEVCAAAGVSLDDVLAGAA